MSVVSTVVIMAAGRGTRMKDLTKDLPKHLLPVLGRPFLDYTIERLRFAGFTRIIILRGHNGQAFDVYSATSDIVLVEQQRFHERYGTAAAVENVKQVVSDEPFAVVAGDNLYGMHDLQALGQYNGHMKIGGYQTPQWQGMGILKQHTDGTLERIIEKPQEFVGDFINASLYLFTPAIFPIIEQLELSSRGEYEITDAINTIAARETVEVVKLKEKWLDLTAPTDIPKIEAALSATL